MYVAIAIVEKLHMLGTSIFSFYSVYIFYVKQSHRLYWDHTESHRLQTWCWRLVSVTTWAIKPEKQTVTKKRKAKVRRLKVLFWLGFFCRICSMLVSYWRSWLMGVGSVFLPVTGWTDVREDGWIMDDRWMDGWMFSHFSSNQPTFFCLLN